MNIKEKRSAGTELLFNKELAKEERDHIIKKMDELTDIDMTEIKIKQLDDSTFQMEYDDGLDWVSINCKDWDEANGILSDIEEKRKKFSI